MGYMGYVDGRYYLFASEGEYSEYVRERREDMVKLSSNMTKLPSKAALMDKQTFLYDDEFLIQNRFALVQYSDTSDTYGNLFPGRQYLAVTQEPDISPCVYIHILSGDPDTEAKVSIEQFSRFDLLSDPLRLLNPWETDWKKNIELQKQIHPGLYTKSA